ncbi:MAG: hypothetical protein E4H07_09005 [Nitrosomonadales bacterium]|nr:MAG: hypothetical protein E4H07_09005 [Nitrosomonadales bacterium]
MESKPYVEHATASITAAAFVLLAGIIFPFSSAIAEPIDLNGSIPLGAGSISGALHGNLTKNILTLNIPPDSKISIDTDASGPLPSSLIPGSFIYTQGYLVELPFGNSDSVSYNVEFTITPHLTANLIVPTWHFGIRGNANLKTGAARFTAAPQPPSAIGAINAISKPTFSGRIATSLDPVAAALAQAALDATLVELNSSGAKLNLHLTGNWEKLSIGSATMVLAQTKPNIKIDLGLTSAILTGKFDYKVDLSFSASANNVFIGSVFEEEIESLIEDELMNRLLNYVNREFDREGNGKFGMYRQDCSSQQLGPTSISASCGINAKFTLTPSSF